MTKPITIRFVDQQIKHKYAGDKHIDELLAYINEQFDAGTGFSLPVDGTVDAVEGVVPAEATVPEGDGNGQGDGVQDDGQLYISTTVDVEIDGGGQAKPTRIKPTP